jgi:hypothetical protein
VGSVPGTDFVERVRPPLQENDHLPRFGTIAFRAVQLALTVIATGCVPDPLIQTSAHAQTTGMLELLTTATRNSDAVVVLQVRQSYIVPVEDVEYLRVIGSVEAFFKGTFKKFATVEVDIPEVGSETPQADTGASYVFFLTAKTTPAFGVERWSLLSTADTVLVPEPGDARKLFLVGMQNVVTAANSNQSDSTLKSYILGTLGSPIALFREDAARMSLGITGWAATEIDVVGRFLADNERNAIPQMERGNWVALVAREAPPGAVLLMARSELAADDSDPLYFGLAERQDDAAQGILVELLRTPNSSLQERALRVAGLLRRTDIIDGFEQELRRNPQADVNEFRRALENARELADRDY